MATTMKSNNAAIAAMQQMLQERCIAEPMFAVKMANPLKSMEGAVNYLCATIQKSRMCCVDDTTVMCISCNKYSCWSKKVFNCLLYKVFPLTLPFIANQCAGLTLLPVANSDESLYTVTLIYI